VFVAFVIDAAFCLSLAGFLIMHLRLVAANCTTIEMYEKRRAPDWPYNRGLRRNFQDVFGARRARARALIPPHHTRAEPALPMRVSMLALPACAGCGVERMPRPGGSYVLRLIRHPSHSGAAADGRCTLEHGATSPAPRLGDVMVNALASHWLLHRPLYTV